MKVPSGKHRDLVLVRAGPSSLHGGWMAPREEEQTFDLMVLAYGPTPLAPERADFGYVDIPGYKVAGYGALLRQHRDILERYDQIALIDDDIKTDSRTISDAFELGRVHDLDVWQPSLTRDSHFSHTALLCLPGGAPVRRVNFVEMMCPFFKTATLLEIEDLFQIGAETAIDIFWSCIVGQRAGALAVLNNVSVIHTRPVGILKASNGFDETTKGYGDEVRRLMADFDIPTFSGAIPLTSSADEPRSPAARLGAALPMLAVLASVTKTPMRLRQFFRILVIDILRVTFGDARIHGDPDRILANARRIRIEREHHDQNPSDDAS